MVTVVILVVIYLAFISLGLPDSILGVSLPSMLEEWGLPLSAGGAISMVVIGGTILSSFLSGFVIRKAGTGKIVFISCLMTGASLLGFSCAPSYFWLIALAVPLGLGGGSVDTALNNYIALHYKARHMNWLHSFWGVGATVGPVIVSLSLQNGGSWRSGYLTIGVIQISLAALLLISLPLWKRAGKGAVKIREVERSGKGISLKSLFALKGAKYAFATLLLYCTVESGVGLWGSSFLMGARRFSSENAASWLAFYYGGITAGRFLSGFLSIRFSNSRMIRAGMLSATAGIILLLFPLNPLPTGMAIVFIGLGLAPVFPSMLHETPVRFGKDLSQVLIGFQMGFAYVGSALFSPLLGLMLQYTDIALFPIYLLGLSLLMILLFERLNLLTGGEREELSVPKIEPSGATDGNGRF